MDEKLEPDFDPTTDNTDVIVVLENDEKYIASFFSYGNIEKLRQAHQANGEYLSGKYFQVEAMVLVDICTKKNIEDVVEHMLEEGDFNKVFKKIAG